MPIRDASRPSPSIRATGCFSPSILGSVSGGPLASSDSTRSLSVIGARVYWLVKTGGMAAYPRLPLGSEPAGRAAEARRRIAVVAPEDLGELGRLAVAHGGRHVLHGQRALHQELCRARHPDALKLAAEARVAGLRKRPLELPSRGRNLARHARQREIVIAVAARDHRARLPVEVASSFHGRCPH